MPLVCQCELGPLKRLLRWSEAGLILEQLYPAKELRFEHRAVVSVHAIVMGGQKLDQW